MQTLISYVRSGQPDLTNRQMALLMLVYLTPGPHTVRGLAKSARFGSDADFERLQKLLGVPARPGLPADRGRLAGAESAHPISPAGRPRVAVVANSFPPYRVHLHEQIVEQDLQRKLRADTRQTVA